MSIAGDGPAANEEDDASTPSLIDIGYPLRLTLIDSKFNYGPGITAGQMWSLQNTWHVIKNHWRQYALELYVDFYTENHDMINRFRDRRTGKINAIILSEHAYLVFGIFKEVVENGLKFWGKTHNRIGQFTKCHVMHGISLEDLTLMADAVTAVILKKCDGLTSPTVEIALDKLFKEIFNQHTEREQVADDDVSVDIDE